MGSKCSAQSYLKSGNFAPKKTAIKKNLESPSRSILAQIGIQSQANRGIE